MREKAERGVEHYAVLAAATLALAVLWAFRTFVTPAPEGYGTHQQFGFPPCLALEYLGVPCPGCGVTTSFTLTARGELGRALRNQPLGLILGVGVVAFFGWSLWQHARGRDAYRAVRALPARALLVAAAFALLACWGYKLAIMS